EADEPLEGGEVLDEAAPATVHSVGVWLEDGVGSDAGEQVVPRQQHPLGGVVEGDVANGVARGDMGLPVAAAGSQGVAVVEEPEPSRVDRVRQQLHAFVEGSERVTQRFRYAK